MRAAEASRPDAILKGKAHCIGGDYVQKLRIFLGSTGQWYDFQHGQRNTEILYELHYSSFPRNGDHMVARLYCQYDRNASNPYWTRSFSVPDPGDGGIQVRHVCPSYQAYRFCGNERQAFRLLIKVVGI